MFYSSKFNGDISNWKFYEYVFVDSMFANSDFNNKSIFKDISILSSTNMFKESKISESD